LQIRIINSNFAEIFFTKIVLIIYKNMRQFKIIKQVTNRDSLSIDKYLQEIGKVSLISPEAEAELARKVRHGDEDALNQLVQCNLRFVVSVSKQYQNQGLSLSDLINEGNVGLIKAAHRFDEQRGFKFISYAVWWIRQSILQALAEQSRVVRLPLNKVSFINKIKKTFSELEQNLGRKATIEEVAEKLETPVKKIKKVFINANKAVSMDAPISDEGDSNLYDVIGSENVANPEDALIRESLQKEIAVSLATLTKKEESIIKLYYGLSGEIPHTLEEIAQEFDLTQERVRQMKSKAIIRLRQSYRNKNLRPFLG